MNRSGILALRSRLRAAPAGAALLAVLAACGGGDRSGGGAEQAPPGGYKTFAGGPPGGTVIVLADREPDDLNPLTFDSNPAYQVVHLLFRALARRDTTLSNYTPDLATRWEFAQDSSTLILHLRRDVKWHDGQPVTAEDVVFTIERQKDKAVASPRQGDVARVLSVTAPDSFTVNARMEHPGPAVVNALLEVVPVPKHILGSVPAERMRFSGFGRNPVGNGLFRFGKWQAGQQLVVTANPAVPEGRPALERVVLRFVPDVNAAMTELLAGQGDMLRIPPDQKERVASSNTVKLYHAPRVRPTWIAWNMKDPMASDSILRRAFLMGLNRPALAKGLFGPDGAPALTVLPADLPAHSATVRPIPYDPAGAQRLLEQNGWRDTNGDGIREKNGRPLQLTIEYNTTDPARRDMLVAMQSELKKIGMQMVPRPYESTAWVERLRGREFQGSFWGWGWGPGVMGPNAEMIFHSRSIPPGGPNFAGYRNPRVDAVIDSILVTFDPAAAKRMWGQFEQLVTDDAVYAPIYMDPELFGANSRIANVKFRGIEWWEDIPYWYIPTNKRLPRDRA